MSFNITPVASALHCSGYQEIHPYYSAMNIDSVKINTSLIMMKECILNHSTRIDLTVDTVYWISQNDSNWFESLPVFSLSKIILTGVLKFKWNDVQFEGNDSHRELVEVNPIEGEILVVDWIHGSTDNPGLHLRVCPISDKYKTGATTNMKSHLRQIWKQIWNEPQSVEWSFFRSRAKTISHMQGTFWIIARLNVSQIKRRAVLSSLVVAVCQSGKQEKW